MAKWAMVIDLEKCAGCQACTAACQMENTRLPGEKWQDVLYYVEGEQPAPNLKWFPRPCMHCENPSCEAVCPTGATFKDKDGFVLVDWDKCIGCKYCMIACPYGARFYSDEQAAVSPNIKKVKDSKGDSWAGDGSHQWRPPYRMPDGSEDHRHGVGVQPPNVVSKCTFCYHRVSKAPAGVVDLDPADPKLRPFTPACVVSCAPGARTFGDLSHPASKVRRLIAEKHGVRLLDHLGNKPKVYYVSGAPGSAVPARRVTTKA
jgi:Fe-S-cluster-containing dehydrogenase component